jgi:Zn-dependent peptidase ImmA (M78 family)
LTVVKDCCFEGLDESDREQMEAVGERCWSGGVYPKPLPDGSRLCVLNPYQSERRRRITLMEEICHCYLEHQPTTLVVNSQGLLVRDFDKRQEEEAYGVGAAVLLPWNFLFPKINQGAPVEELSEIFDVTRQLVEYRIKICGATALFRARTHPARAPRKPLTH